uniref:CCHC-type domain-containing protein n=1 Tax=Photinus pyralis TaxID=7054 RepID=A0A1Y1KKM1_PHOPY
MECFICKQSGHIASNCPSPPPNNLPPKTHEKPSCTENSTTSVHQPNTSVTAIKPSQKRCHSDTLTSSDHINLQGESTQEVLQEPPVMPPPEITPKAIKPVKSARKRRKTNISPETVLSEDTKSIIRERYQTTPSAFTLPVEHFIAFLENTYDNSDPCQEALKFTSDIKSLLSDIHRIYPFLNERSIKNRFTRLTKRIKTKTNFNAEKLDSSTNFISEELETGSISSIFSQSSEDLDEEDSFSDDPQLSHISTS